MNIQKPTPKQLQERYGIPNSEFKVLVKNLRPTKAEYERNGDMLEEVAAWVIGVPVFFLRSGATGLVATVIVVALTMGPKVEFAKDLYAAGRDYMRFPNQGMPYDITFNPHSMSNVAATSSTVVYSTFTDGTGNV